MAGASPSTKRNVIVGLTVGLVAAIVIAAITIGIGRPGVPDGAVAVVDGVDDGEVSQERFDRSLEQSAARLGLDEPPPPDDPQFEQIKDETMQGLLLEIWAEGEAENRGIEVTETDVQGELDQITQSFGSKKEFARVVEQSKFCTEEELDSGTEPIECADVQRQGRLLALQRKLAEAFSVQPEIADSEVERFYDANVAAFERPTSRDVRVILNEDEAEVEKAKSELEGVSPEDGEAFEDAWRSAARKYSQDQASKDRGGLLEGVVEGQGDPQLDEEVFAAPEGELVGPFETDRGFYLIQVVEVTEASTQSLEEASEGIRQQLAAARQQAAEAEIQNDFIVKWTARTVCDEEVAMSFCSNFVAQALTDVPPGTPAQPEPAAVLSTAPIEPGTAELSVDGSTQTGLPQGPKVPQPEQQDAGGLPPDAVPIGPDGAPAPGGGAPPAP